MKLLGHYWPNEKKKLMIMGFPMSFSSRNWHPVGIRKLVSEGVIRQISFEHHEHRDVWKPSERDQNILTSELLSTYEDCYRFSVLSPTQLEIKILEGTLSTGRPLDWRCTWVVECEDVMKFADIHNAVQYKWKDHCQNVRLREIREAEEARISEIGDELISRYIEENGNLSTQ